MNEPLGYPMNAFGYDKSGMRKNLTRYYREFIRFLLRLNKPHLHFFKMINESSSKIDTSTIISNAEDIFIVKRKRDQLQMEKGTGLLTLTQPDQAGAKACPHENQ